MLVDFTELRNRVLAGEEDAEAEALPSPLAAETTGNNITLAALLVGGGVLAVRMLDRIKYEGKIFQPDESGTDYGKFVSVAFGWIPLSFGLGRVSRGVKAQDEIGKYESLVSEAENFVQEMEEEMVVKEAEAAEAQQQAAAAAKPRQQFDLLGDTSDWKLHTATPGPVDFGGFGSTSNAYGAAIGQQPVFYRRNNKTPSSPF